MSIIVSISAFQTPTPDADADEMSNSRHSSRRFSVTLLVFSQANHTTSQVLTTFYVVFGLNAWALSVIATASWLGGWVSVTLRYCIKTAKPIRKLFRPSESPIILVFWDPCADTKFQGDPISGGVKYTGVWKLAIFVRFSTYIAVYHGNRAR